ncbi:MAG: DNA-binding response regulator [Alphaproteobacteria bacterium]|nr:response regulator transcription factor [Alphaproteobacteria bacterium]TAD88899.1 MAG: DNA-binding response regulator [Alphaproteobacteria bacterium]
MRVLLLEDRAIQASSLTMMLETAGHEVAPTGLAEVEAHPDRLGRVDLALVDLAAHGQGAAQRVARLTAAVPRLPVLVLSDRQTLPADVRALGIGEDRHLPRPFDKRGLLARMQGLVKRGRERVDQAIRVGRLSIRLDARQADVDGQPLPLTGKEFAVLALLAEKRGITLTKEMFLNHLYAGRPEPELKIIDVFICKLRKKIAKATGGPTYIETVWGRGYVMRG